MTILCNCAATLAPEIITHFLSLKQHAQWSHLDLIYSYCSNHTAAGPLLLIEYDISLVWYLETAEHFPVNAKVPCRLAAAVISVNISYHGNIT